MLQDFYHLKRDNNPLREDAFTLPCLGKLFPASVHHFLRCRSWMADLMKTALSGSDVSPNESQERILIIGLTESGIIPAFLMYLETITQYRNTQLIFSTRRPMNGLSFHEVHSHGPNHILPRIDGEFSRIWIVEDEITSGNTLFNIMMQLHRVQGFARYDLFSIADFRTEAQKADLLNRTAEAGICCTVHNSHPDICMPRCRPHAARSNSLYLARQPDLIASSDLETEDLASAWHRPDLRPATGPQTRKFLDSSHWQIPAAFTRGTLLVMGEAVDMAACLVLANPGLSFQQITLSPWKVDQKAIYERIIFDDCYYLYNPVWMTPPVFLLYDPIDTDMAMTVYKTLSQRGIPVTPFAPIQTPSCAGIQVPEKTPCPSAAETRAEAATWNQKFYLILTEEVHPFEDRDRFRPLDKAYNGDNTFWSTPSPEPDMPDKFWEAVALDITSNTVIPDAASLLAGAILKKYPDPEKLLFVSILRAGVPITDWLCRLLPGAKGAALSLFVGLGVDAVALSQVLKDFPDRTLIFVDGWTGRGGVARALAELDVGPLAVLVDPWGWADFSGIQADVFCPSACFTGLTTLGFSRTFFTSPDQMFAAYRFAERFQRRKLIYTWRQACPGNPSAPRNITRYRFQAASNFRIHSNEVCRALINAAPKHLFFADSKSVVETEFRLILWLAEIRSVPVTFNASNLAKLKTRVACTLA